MGMATAEQPATKEPGVYNDIGFEEYLAIDAFSKSIVAPILRSPAHFRRRQDIPIDTEALRMGSLTDTLVFEPGQFLERFAVRPSTYVNDKGQKKPWNMNSKICQGVNAQLVAEGKAVVGNAGYQEAMRYKDAVLSHPRAQELLADGRPQVTIIWQDEESGLLCKGRIDWVTAQGLVDLKTTVDASLEGFPRQMYKFGYHIQAAMYCDGWKALTGEDLPFILLPVEKNGPAEAVGAYIVGDASILVGRNVYKRAMFVYRNCRATGKWPGYSQFLEPLDIPRFAIRAELGEEADDDEF